MSANLNLAEMVNEGKDLYFDCPPIDYNFKQCDGHPYFSTVETKDGVQVVSEVSQIMQERQNQIRKILKLDPCLKETNNRLM